MSRQRGLFGSGGLSPSPGIAPPRGDARMPVLLRDDRGEMAEKSVLLLVILFTAYGAFKAFGVKVGSLVDAVNALGW